MEKETKGANKVSINLFSLLLPCLTNAAASPYNKSQSLVKNDNHVEVALSTITWYKLLLYIVTYIVGKMVYLLGKGDKYIFI